MAEKSADDYTESKFKLRKSPSLNSKLADKADRYNVLKEYKKLFEEGVIDEADFKRIKTAILK